jgi:hypothetical protein
MKKIMIGVLAISLLAVSAFAVPNQLTYAGRLLQNGALVNSTLQMDFYIYNHLTNSSVSLWSTTNVNVDVNQGIYSVFLGDDRNPISPNVFVTDNAYLQVVVGGEALVPRTKINSVGYALMAGGLTASGGGSAVVVGPTGNIGIGTASPAAKLHLLHDGAVAGQAELRIDGYGASNGQITFRGAGHTNAAAGIRHLNTNNSTGDLAFYANNVSSVNLFERMRINSAGNIGVGISDPYAGGAVTSRFTIKNDQSTSFALIGSANAKILAINPELDGGVTFYNGGGAGAIWTPVMTLKAGALGIGTTAPAGKLEINTNDYLAGSKVGIGSSASFSPIEVMIPNTAGNNKSFFHCTRQARSFIK